MEVGKMPKEKKAKKVKKAINYKLELKSLLMPALIITIICLVSATILVGTYEITKPIIEANNEKRADAARSQVFSLAGSQGFSEISNEELIKDFEGRLPDGLIKVYVANNNKGMVLTTEDKGFGGSILVVTGIDNKGKITGIAITDHKETPGLGTKAMTVEFLDQYMGKIKIDSSKDAKQDVAIDAVTGATVSSDAVYRAVEKALLSYKGLGGVPNDF
jgi:electron transport complex protein RnfG